MIDVNGTKPEHLWYFVGLIATDGNLSPDKRHLVVTSKDIDHLENIRKAFSLPKVGRKSSGTTKEKIYGVLQFGDVGFYRYLLSIGLSPNKSLTLKELSVPNKFFPDFLRGVIDGDGCIRKWIHPSNGRTQWEVKIVSGSPDFIDWLELQIENVYKVTGSLAVAPVSRIRKNPLFILKFGKMAAQKILSCYTHSTLALARKSVLAQECLQTKAGWSKSLTVLH